MFNLKELKFYEYIFLNKATPFYFFEYLEKTFKWICFVTLVLFIASYFGLISIFDIQEMGALVFLSGGLWFMFFYVYSFFTDKTTILEDKDILKLAKEKDNLALALDFYAASLIYPTFNLSSSLILKRSLDDKRLDFVYKKAGIDKKEFSDFLDKGIQQKSSENFPEILLENALKISMELGHRDISIGDLFVASILADDNVKDYFVNLDLEEDDLKSLIFWEGLNFYSSKPKKKLDPYYFLYSEGIGKSWSYGYTPNLNKFSYNILDYVRDQSSINENIHRETIESVAEVLAKETNNSLVLVGESGVGRTTIVYGLAKAIIEGRSLSELNYKKMLMLDVASIVSSSTSMEDIERLLITVLNEAARAGNIILVVDNFSDYIGAESGIGKIDISSVLSSYLKSHALQLIGITTFQGYHDKIDVNPSIKSLLDRIMVNEPSINDTIKIMEGRVSYYEKKYGFDVSYQVLKEIATRSDELIADMPFPKKAINTLEEIIVYAAHTSKHPKDIGIDDIYTVLQRKTGVPLGSIKEEEKEKLLSLEDNLHKRIVDQDIAITLITQAMKRGRLEISALKKPIGSFLFLGPTGVGKTETSKALSDIYFGSEDSMIRLDMSEYQNVESVNRFIGSSSEDLDQAFVTKVREKPFSLILLDEIEKANPKILNLFLQILDDGRLTDVLGRTVSFKNTIIIATSNAGSNLIRKAVGDGRDLMAFHKELLNWLQDNNIFSPEFLNRFDAVVVFKPLAKEHLLQIAHIMISALNKKMKEKHNIEIIENADLLSAIADIGYEPEFGARPMQRAIQNTLEVIISDKLLKEEIKRGDKVSISGDEIRKQAALES